MGAAMVVAEQRVAAASSRFGKVCGGGTTIEAQLLAHVTCAACCPGMCRVHADGEKEGWRWRTISSSFGGASPAGAGAILATCAWGTNNGAWCVGVYWGVCGLMCGNALDRVMRRWPSRVAKPSLPARSSVRAAAHPRAFSQKQARLGCAVFWRQFSTWTQSCSVSKGGLQTEQF